jgi:Gas vesicle synthesis protein GvpL/GvpF
MSGPTGRASYAYAIARSFDPARLVGVRGVDGAEVRLVPYREIVAVVSPVPLAEFDEAALRAKLERLPWLEATARAHHAVVDAVAAHSVTLPLRLATVYRGDERVAEVLRQGYRRFRTALDRLAGRVELGVKVYTDPPAAAPATAPPASSPGRDYLRRRRAQQRARDDAWQCAATAATQVDATLARLAIDRRHRPPQPPRLSGAPGENVLNATYLVDAERAEEFAAKARNLGAEAQGTRIELTGPWAPYSFALPDDEEPV